MLERGTEKRKRSLHFYGPTVRHRDLSNLFAAGCVYRRKTIYSIENHERYSYVCCVAEIRNGARLFSER